MFKRVLVAIDGSPTAAEGLAAAFELAAQHHAALIALYVIDDSVLPVNFDAAVYRPPYIDAYLAAQKEFGRKLLARAASTAAKQRVKLESILIRSHLQAVSGVIVAQASKVKA